MKLFDFVDCNCYIPAFFSIKMNNTLSVDNTFGTVHEHELFHEYIHFLQDIMTSYGLMNTRVVYEKIIAGRHFIKNSQGIKLPLETFGNRILDANNKLFDLYLGYTESKKVGDIVLIKVNCKQEMFNHPVTNELVNISIYELEFSDGNSYQFGAHAILEGIAHYLEKTIYDIDSCKQIPYDLSYSLWCFSLPESKENIKAFLDVSEFSLMCYNPAEYFIDAIEKIKQNIFPIDEDLYSNLMKHYKVKREKRNISLWENFVVYLDDTVKQGKVLFSSTIYDEFKDWWLKLCFKGRQIRQEREPIFSKFLDLKEFSDKDRASYLKEYFTDFCYPLVTNADGEFDFLNKNNPNYLASFLTVQSIHSVFNYLFTINSGCELKETCIFLRDSYGMIEVDDDCDKSPWKKELNTKNICFFKAVLKSFGLDSLTFHQGE